MPPTIANILQNKIATWMQPYDPCVVIMDRNDQTSIIAYNGILGYVVTSCLFDVL